MLNGMSVTLCGVPMPLLYAADGQINAIVPQVPQGSAQCPLVVTVGGQASASVQLTIMALQPGICSVNFSGSGPGVVTNALTGKLNSASDPARAGEFLSVYATGLGPVQGPDGEAGPAEGLAAPLSAVFRTKAVVTATIGGSRCAGFVCWTNTDARGAVSGECAGAGGGGAGERGSAEDFGGWGCVS